jgi:hypothetical protein
VEFAVAARGQMSFGHPHPSPVFQPGEGRVVETGVQATMDDEVIGYVACYDITGRYLYAFWPSGRRRVYDIKRLRPDKVSPATLMTETDPGFDISRMTPVRYKTVERSD